MHLRCDKNKKSKQKDLQLPIDQIEKKRHNNEWDAQASKRKDETGVCVDAFSRTSGMERAAPMGFFTSLTHTLTLSLTQSQARRLIPSASPPTVVLAPGSFWRSLTARSGR